MSDEVPTAMDAAAVDAVKAHMDWLRKFQQSPEGIRARKRFDAEQLEKQRAAREEICDLRGVPDDIEVRRWALSTHPTGPLFDAVSMAIRWKQDRESELGGAVPAMRFLIGAPGTGKTSALAWAAVSWPKRALYVTADVLSRSKDEATWRDATNVSLLVLDELGIETTADRTTELMLQRWSKGKLTLCGTNLTPQEIIARYMTSAGGRLLDRLAHQRANGLPGYAVADWVSHRGIKTTRPEDF
jgi:hypothetical protein